MGKYAILGPVELRDGERRVKVGGPRQVALLALLLVNANRALSSDQLIDALWGERGPDGAVKRLQVAVARLRRTLDPDGMQGDSALRTTAGGYLLAVAPGELDADLFETRTQDGRRALEDGDAERARGALRDALRLWRGPALADVAYEAFAQGEARRLEELRLAALEARIDADLALGEHAGVIAELEALRAAHPAREHLAAQLMLALYRCERQADALDVYARTRTYLASEMGLEPGPGLQLLQAEVLAQSPTLQRDAPGGAADAGGEEDAPPPAAALPTGVVTFLMTDIEGSTRLWDADADAMAAALEFHDALIAHLVALHDGRLLKEKGEGDSTLSAFQRASGAVACAAALQRALAETAGLDLRLRIGVHSGEAHERAGDYFGPALNRAARLRALASGGVTVLSQTTAELVRDRLPAELSLVDVGRHELPGLSRPEHVFELRATVVAPGGSPEPAAAPVSLPLPRPLQDPGGPLVGREPELARLREGWSGVTDGARSAVLLGGEAGIGKTRLASEFALSVHAQGALVLYGRCDEGLAVPYQPFVEALRPYARALGADGLRAEIGGPAAELARLLPEMTSLGTPIRADPESERYSLFEAVAALLEAASRERPVLLLLDDLHWAAHPTLLLLRHLIRSERRLAVTLLGTYRETELDADGQLARLLADLHRDASVQLLSVSGIDEEAIAALLRATGDTRRPQRIAELARLLLSETAGNPFFVRELLAHLVESGGTSRASARKGSEIIELDVPERVRQVIRGRVARLSEGAQHALRVGSVAGPTFSPLLLEGVVDASAGLLDALDEAVAAGLLVEAGHGELVFGHALVRQTIYRDLSSARRMRLHGALGEALEAAGAGQTDVEVLAHHFAEAAAVGYAAQAADYALAAGSSAIARLGYEDAVGHCERGLAALAPAGGREDRRRCELLLALGGACSSAGEIDKAQAACLQAAALADELGDEGRLARAALCYCGPLFFSISVGAEATEPSVDLLERALGRLAEDDSALRAQLMARLAAALAYSGPERRRPQLARDALAMARRVADPATLADVLATTHWSIRGPDSLGECLAMTGELASLAGALGEVRLGTYAQQWLLDHRLERGEIELADRELADMERRVEALGRQQYLGWLLAVVQARHAHLRGRIAACEQFAHDAVTLGFEGRDQPIAHTFGAQMLFVRREQGRLEELVPAIAAFTELYPEIAAWRCALAYAYAAVGRTEEAGALVDVLARADFEDLPRDGLWIGSVATLCEVAWLLDDAPRAALLYDLLAPFADGCAVLLSFICQGSLARPLGLVASVLSRHEEAAAQFEAALAMNAAVGSPLWVAYTQHDYAHLLLRRGRTEDVERARGLLDAALATVEELGLASLAARVRPLRLRAYA